VGAGRDITLADLPVKSHERLFFERVPVAPAERQRIRLRRPEDYARLAQGVEAWGFRAIQERGAAMTRHEVAAAWMEREYLPVVAMLREADLCRGGEDETEAYLRVAAERSTLLRSHEWTEDLIRRLQAELGPPRRGAP
jgi:hypothetical protein